MECFANKTTNYQNFPHHQSQKPYLLHLLKHPPLLLQYFSLLVDQRPLLLTEEPLQLLDLVLLAPEGLNQLLLALRQLQLQHKSVLRGNLIGPYGKERKLSAT